MREIKDKVYFRTKNLFNATNIRRNCVLRSSCGNDLTCWKLSKVFWSRQRIEILLLNMAQERGKKRNRRLYIPDSLKEGHQRLNRAVTSISVQLKRNRTEPPKQEPSSQSKSVTLNLILTRSSKTLLGLLATQVKISSVKYITNN